jgi:hypothetical protein
MVRSEAPRGVAVDADPERSEQRIRHWSIHRPGAPATKP